METYSIPSVGSLGWNSSGGLTRQLRGYIQSTPLTGDFVVRIARVKRTCRERVMRPVRAELLETWNVNRGVGSIFPFLGRSTKDLQKKTVYRLFLATVFIFFEKALGFSGTAMTVTPLTPGAQLPGFKSDFTITVVVQLTESYYASPGNCYIVGGDGGYASPAILVGYNGDFESLVQDSTSSHITSLLPITRSAHIGCA